MSDVNTNTGNGNGSKFSLSNPIVLAVLLGGGTLGGTGLGSALSGGDPELQQKITNLELDNKSLQEAYTALREDMNELQNNKCAADLALCEKWKEDQMEKRLRKLEGYDSED